MVYPQPASGDTVYFYYRLDQPGLVEIEIYNVAGERAITLRENKSAAGYARTLWDIRNAAGGIYFFRLRVKTSVGETLYAIKKLVIVKLRR